MKYAAMAEFLRKRREALKPVDVGLTVGSRRRTPGLRREEVAALASMSADYYGRLESGNSPQPSEAMLTSIARALHLTLDERDHLFVLAGHGTPSRRLRQNHVSPGLMRVMDRLTDTPALILNRLTETLAQTPSHIALDSDHSLFAGDDSTAIARWFTNPAERALYHESERANHSRVLISLLRRVSVADGQRSEAARLVDRLMVEGSGFAALWNEHEVGIHHAETKMFQHPAVGDLLLHCDVLHDADQGQTLLVFTASPGTESYEKLQLLSVIGTQQFETH